jgi:hypothetical protein
MRGFQLAAIVFCLSASHINPALASYGLDIVPESTFYHHNDWNFYGADPVPNSYKHTGGLATSFGVDAVPGVVRDRLDVHPQHELIAETIQHLTGAIEYTPSRKADAVKSRRAAKSGAGKQVRDTAR